MACGEVEVQHVELIHMHVHVLQLKQSQGRIYQSCKTSRGLWVS